MRLRPTGPVGFGKAGSFEGFTSGGGIARLAAMLRKKDPNCRVQGQDLGCRYVQHGAIDKLYDYYGLSAEKIASAILEDFRCED